MAGRTQVATKSSALIAMIVDEDTVTGFLLAGVGNVDLRRKTNYLIVDSKTTVKAIEDAFKEFTTKEDITIVLISQYTDCVTKEMKALGWWLMLVGTLRLASVWLGFFDIWALRLAVFSKTQMTDVHGRTFGVWTLLTCTLCFLCALNLDNKPIYVATFLSFIYAFGHFLTEYLIYHTMALSNLTTVGIFAGTSIIWMLLQWNAHQQPRISKQK